MEFIMNCKEKTRLKIFSLKVSALNTTRQLMTSTKTYFSNPNEPQETLGKPKEFKKSQKDLKYIAIIGGGVFSFQPFNLERTVI